MRRILSCHPKQMGLQSILCIGIALSNRCKLPIIPTDLFPRDLAEIIQKPYARVKITFDVTCLLVTACLTYFALGRILGLGIGTVAAAFTMGKGVAIAGSFIDKKMTFISFLHKASDNDKNTFHLPWHSSFTIMQSFAKWGNTGKNVAQTRMNTTVSTTKD
jgi:hypothetical protein